MPLRLYVYRCLSKWRKWIRPVVMASYVLIVFCLLPFLIVKLENSGTDTQSEAWLIGGVFALLALPITFWEISQHLIHYTQPHLQKHIIRILWMVPIYALNAWLGLLLPQYAIYMDTCRECYEAYVIYNFMMYLLNFLNSGRDLGQDLSEMPQVEHFFPCCCLPPWKMGWYFVNMCRHGILQYTVVRPITTIISLICELSNVYGENEFRGDRAYPYMVAINNLSQFVAMYCLVMFYRANKEMLRPMSPVGKFLCIKAVVFFSFFQGVIISILVWTGVIEAAFTSPDSTDKKDVKSIAMSLQDFLICIEMFLAAVAHYYAFSYQPYVNLAAPQHACCDNFLEMWDVSDVRQDVREHIDVMTNTMKKSVSGAFKSGSQTERAKLLSSSRSSSIEEGTPASEDFEIAFDSRRNTL